MISLTGISFYDIPQLNLGEHLSDRRDIYLSETQLCGRDGGSKSGSDERDK